MQQTCDTFAMLPTATVNASGDGCRVSLGRQRTCNANGAKPVELSWVFRTIGTTYWRTKDTEYEGGPMNCNTRQKRAVVGGGRWLAAACCCVPILCSCFTLLGDVGGGEGDESSPGSLFLSGLV